MVKLTAEILNAAILGFEEQKKQIDAQIAELHQMLHSGPKPASTAASEAAPKMRKISAAARRRMALAQKKRWAAIKGDAGSPEPAKAKSVKPKHRLSAAGKAAIVAALNRRWAAKRAEAAKAKPPAAKKKAAA